MNKKLRKIPYGLSDFARMREENFYYVDKTRFIEKIEDSSLYLFFIRPRRFGKSLFLSLMENYYDIDKKDNFELLFKGTYIYDNPTDEKNKYMILKFNFSEVNSRVDKVEGSFNQVIRLSCLSFLKKYKNYLKNNYEEKYKTINETEDASAILSYLISFVEGYGKIYLLIDEYDNFTNTIISSTGHEQYMAITHGEGFYRHFFNVIKAGTTGGPISKLFITGVSPVTMDDVTSGFNIGDNITTAPSFNEMVGFTEAEVEILLNYYGINEPSIINIMKFWYDNYLFAKYEKTRMYNSDMALYFVKEYHKAGNLPEDMLDNNIRTDYKKLKYLIAIDMEGKYRLNGNFEKLRIILEEGQITANIVNSFPVNRIIDPENFISLLYYFGLLTIKDSYHGKPILTIPNEVIRQLYYEYIREGYRDTKVFNIDLFRLGSLFDEMAFKGRWEDLFIYLTSEMNKQTSVRDYIEGERSIQTFFRAYLNVSNYYITKTEFELNKGYCDILMLPNLLHFPDIEYSYLIEMKYIKPSEYSETKLEEKIKDAEEKINKYKNDESLKSFTGDTHIINIILVFSGIELKYIDVSNKI